MSNLMLLRPGRSIDEAIRLLEELSQSAMGDIDGSIPRIDSASFGQLMPTVILAYERWTMEVQRKLRAVFKEIRVVSRVRAEKYWVIVGGAPSSARAASMLHIELAELQAYFSDIANELRATKANFASTPRWVLDTNDLLHYNRLDLIPWKVVYGKEAHIMLPHVVIDEIDSKGYNAGPSIRKRARGVYRMLEQLLERTDENGQMTLRDGSILEILADDPDEKRLPNNDDEIVIRSVVLQQAVYPATVTIVTRDIGMRTRALAQGLQVAKIPDKYLIREDGLSSADLDDAMSAITPSSSEVSAQ